MPSDQPRLDRWRDRARDHRVLAPLLAAAAVVILVGAVIGAVQTIVDVGSDGTTTTPRTTTSPGTPVNVGDLGRDVNQRYAFSFAYPRAWSRRLTATASDPVNEDGATYVAPRAPGVQVAAWGSLGTLSSGTDAASRLRDELRLADENGDEVLEQGAYGLFWEPRAGASAAQRRRIPGYRLVVRFDDAETQALGDGGEDRHAPGGPRRHAAVPGADDGLRAVRRRVRPVGGVAVAAALRDGVTGAPTGRGL